MKANLYRELVSSAPIFNANLSARSVSAFIAAFVIAQLLFSASADAASIAYIHGRVANDGTILDEGVGEPYDQMLITDTGRTGLSRFRTLVENEGHTIEQFRDQGLNFNSAFVNQFDLIIFGLHQRVWSNADKQVLDQWLQAGGGMFIYSDSASGGFFREVGAQNPVGQTVTNNLIATYGMQVTVDQADGTTPQTANQNTSISGVNGLILEGEGVSPVAISPSDSSIEVLVPYSRTRDPEVRHQQNLTIEPRIFASMVLKPVGQGHVIVMFDRQPMWNDGPGSSIQRRNNGEILREVVNFLGQSSSGNPNPGPPSPEVPRTGEAMNIVPIIRFLLEDSWPS